MNQNEFRIFQLSISSLKLLNLKKADNIKNINDNNNEIWMFEK